MDEDASTPSDIVGMLMRIAPALARLQNELLGALDPRLTYRQYRLLVLVERGRCYPTALKAATSLSLGTISASVEALVGRGLLRRTPNENDRRRITLHVTDDGTRAIRQGQVAMADLAGRLTDAFPPEPDWPMHERMLRVLRRTQQELVED